MSFQPRESGNTSARPKGTRTKLVPLATFRQSLKGVVEHSKDSHPGAQNLLVQAPSVHPEWVGLGALKIVGTGLPTPISQMQLSTRTIDDITNEGFARDQEVTLTNPV